MKVGLIQWPKPAKRPGRNVPLPNVALMRLSSWHKAQGDEVVLNPGVFDRIDRLYISTLYTWQRQGVEQLAAQFRANSEVAIGGSGWDLALRLPPEVDAMPNDYELFGISYGMGYSSRGCPRKCGWCPVPKAEGEIREDNDLNSLLNPASNRLMLLDNNFGASNWRPKIEEIERRGLVVDWPQGLDIRLLDDEQATALGRLKERGQISSDRFTAPGRLHFAWDQASNIAKPEDVMRGIGLLALAGFTPHDLTFYVLVGYKGYRIEEEVERLTILHALGIQPYVMVYRDYGEQDLRDPDRSRLRQWNNGHAWRNVRFEDFRPTIRGARRPGPGQMVIEA